MGGVGAWKMRWMLLKSEEEQWEAGGARLKLEGFMVLLGATLLTFIVHVLVETMQKKKKKPSYLAAHTYTLKLQ